ncbi:type II secretion system F family protein [Loktanella sp. Alg231-35]|uniref:type II secretion system F family protein n=1 Tax=Loktanella sp. Alg231-35 TaxID=1922220 RepID=UPI00131EF179|nr:type II secretion system F family protein [Loktanella sp. Alg231-35]
MPRFVYNAIDQGGARATGEVVAADQISALDLVAAKGLTPIDLRTAAHSQPWWNRDIALFGEAALKPKELEAFFSALSAMLMAKTPLPKALEFCADLTTDPMMKPLLENALEKIEDGLSLADALSDGSPSFPERLVTMIRLGESSNNLGPVVKRAARMLESEARLRGEVQQALIYPIILLSMSVFVLSVLIFYLAPTLAPVFASADTAPPTIIAIMLAVQRATATDWPLILVGITAIGVLGYAARSSIKTLVHALFRWLPGYRKYTSKKETLLLCQTLYLMLSSGGHITDALRTAADATGNQSWRAMLTKANQGIEDGQSLGEALLGDPRIDQMTSTILKTGEESDQLVSVLGPTIATLQVQTSQMLSQTVKLLTPILTLVIGLAVGAIILSTISAIMDLNDVVL